MQQRGQVQRYPRVEERRTTEAEIRAIELPEEKLPSEQSYCDRRGHRGRAERRGRWLYTLGGRHARQAFQAASATVR